MIEDQTAFPRDLDRIETPHGVFHGLPGDFIMAELERYGSLQGDDLALVLSLVRPGDVVLDIGANIGAFAVPLARKAGTNGHVIAVEADPGISRILDYNIAHNGLDTVTVLNRLVGASGNGYRKIEIAGNCGSTSYVPDEQCPDQTSAPLALDAIGEDMLRGQPVSLVKIDVEGMEYGVLASGERLLATAKPVIYLEVFREKLAWNGHEPKDIDSLLTKAGYHMFRNTGTADVPRLARLSTCSRGENLFNVLAVHPDDMRYPKDARSEAFLIRWLAGQMVSRGLRRIRRNLTKGR